MSIPRFRLIPHGTNHSICCVSCVRSARTRHVLLCMYISRAQLFVGLCPKRCLVSFVAKDLVHTGLWYRAEYLGARAVFLLFRALHLVEDSSIKLELEHNGGNPRGLVSPGLAETAPSD
jgi:hypothetical protein